MFCKLLVVFAILLVTFLSANALNQGLRSNVALRYHKKLLYYIF